MTKHIIRVVALALIPALLLDPISGASLAEIPSAPSTLTVTRSSVFTSEALTLALLTPLHAYAQESAVAVRQEAAQTIVQTTLGWPGLLTVGALLVFSLSGLAVWARYRHYLKDDSRQISSHGRTKTVLPPLQFQVKQSRVFIHKSDDVPGDPVIPLWTYLIEGRGFMHTRRHNINTILKAFEIPETTRVTQVGLVQPQARQSLYVPESEQAFIWHHTGGDRWHLLHTERTLRQILRRLSPGGILIYFQISEQELTRTLNLVMDKLELPFSEVHIFYPGPDAPLEVPVAVFVKEGGKPQSDPLPWRMIESMSPAYPRGPAVLQRAA